MHSLSLTIFSLSLLILCLSLSVQAARAGDAWLQALYTPEQTTRAKLSPDGQYLAYTVHTGVRLDLCIVSVDEPSKKVIVPLGRDLTMKWAKSVRLIPARVTALRWITTNQLVYGVQSPFELTSPQQSAYRRLNADGTSYGASQELRVVKPDGSGNRLLVNEELVAEERLNRIGLANPIGRTDEVPQLVDAESDFAAGTLPSTQQAMVAVPRRYSVLNVLSPEYPTAVYVAAAGRDVRVEVFRVDTRSGRLHSVAREMTAGPFLCDGHGQPRVAASHSRAGAVEYRIRPAAGVQFLPFADYFGANCLHRFEYRPRHLWFEYARRGDQSPEIRA